jgi:hypothetical protein
MAGVTVSGAATMNELHSKLGALKLELDAQSIDGLGALATTPRPVGNTGRTASELTLLAGDF